MNAFTLATVLGNDHLPSAKAYISNAATEIYAFLTVRDFFTKPLSYAAYVVRRSMMEGGTRERVEALAGMKRQCLAQTGHSWPIFGDASMKMMSYSNWTKGKYFETDFSAAIVKEGLPVPLGQKNQVSRPWFNLTRGPQSSTSGISCPL